MLKDHNFDLAQALAKKSSALWRYKNHYLPNSLGCDKCQALWKKIEEDDDKHTAMLKEEIERHIAEGRFD